jgi:DnaK suppressor protein
MDQDQARELLARERARLEEALQGLERDGFLEATGRREPGDEDSEDLYQDELTAGRVQELRAEMASLERAESRLKDGTYGLSVESGDPIPDERLRARPLAERTVQEEERYRRG